MDVGENRVLIAKHLVSARMDHGTCHLDLEKVEKVNFINGIPSL